MNNIDFVVVIFKVAKCHIKLELKSDSFTELRGEIAGPPDTPYEGAIYVLDIKIPETYPFNPPKGLSSLL
jgi:ubiquitin-conjugating enzyme (huntingtin interacting protein 2)